MEIKVIVELFMNKLYFTETKIIYDSTQCIKYSLSREGFKTI